MKRLLIVALPVLACLALAGSTGCQKSSAQKPLVLTKVEYSLPVQDDVTEFVLYTGRINAQFMATIQARVTGLLKTWEAKDGQMVTKGQTLCVIDQEPFATQLAAADASVKQNKANKDYAVATFKRFKELKDKYPGSVSDQQLAQYDAQQEQAIASLMLAEENKKLANLNLTWTKVEAPFAGRMSRRFKEAGNIINQDSTQLTTVVSIDPVFVYFDIDEPTILRIKRAIESGAMSRINPGGDQPRTNKVLMKLVDEQDYVHEGDLDFTDNQVNAGTGSISARGVFTNPKVKEKSHKFVPGMFVRIKLPLSNMPKKQYVIREEAILTEQKGKYVWIIDDKNKAQKRSVRLGQSQENGMRVILETDPDGQAKKDDGNAWLTHTDKVIVSQLMRVTDGVQIDEPKLVPMWPEQEEKAKPPKKDKAAK